MIGSKETYGRYLVHLRKKFTESQDQDSQSKAAKESFNLFIIKLLCIRLNSF